MKKQIESILEEIKNLNKNLVFNKKYKTLKIMEVCGTHTMAIAKHGIRQLIPGSIDLISGPGCPVCVTPIKEIDKIIEIIKKYDATVFTFGDMMRVPGTNSSLLAEKARGKKIKICYSPTDALDYAENNPDKKIIFLAIGFETTIPLTAVTVKRAFEKKLNNFFVYSTHKTLPQALNALLSDSCINIGGFLMPGHVSAITGSSMYEGIPQKYGIACVISGFEPKNILLSIRAILRQIAGNDFRVEIMYKSVVRPEGNPLAFSLISDVFEPADSEWRGLGTISGSGLELKKKFAGFDAKKIFPVANTVSREPSGCRCGDVIKGIIKPFECKKFGKSCTPENPVGACMVSTEGTCAAYFKYMAGI